MRPSTRSDHYFLTEKGLVPSSTMAPTTSMRQIGDICQALYTEAFPSFCHAYDRKMCSDLPRNHCFCLHMVWTAALFLLAFSCAHGCLRDLLLDLSRLLGLTLRPSALVFRCHREAFDTLKAGICAGSCTWYLSFVFLFFVFLDGEVPNRILTACEEFLFKSC